MHCVSDTDRHHRATGVWLSLYTVFQIAFYTTKCLAAVCVRPWSPSQSYWGLTKFIHCISDCVLHDQVAGRGVERALQLGALCVRPWSPSQSYWGLTKFIHCISDCVLRALQLGALCVRHWSPSQSYGGLTKFIHCISDCVLHDQVPGRGVCQTLIAITELRGFD